MFLQVASVRSRVFFGCGKRAVHTQTKRSRVLRRETTRAGDTALEAQRYKGGRGETGSKLTRLGARGRFSGQGVAGSFDRAHVGWYSTVEPARLDTLQLDSPLYRLLRGRYWRPLLKLLVRVTTLSIIIHPKLLIFLPPFDHRPSILYTTTLSELGPLSLQPLLPDAVMRYCVRGSTTVALVVSFSTAGQE